MCCLFYKGILSDSEVKTDTFVLQTVYIKMRQLLISVFDFELIALFVNMDMMQKSILETQSWKG